MITKPRKTIDQRWEDGDEHDPRSVALYQSIAKLDRDGDDYFDFRCGGDGDNGEELMYLLDMHFEAEDEGLSRKPRRRGGHDGR